MLNEAQLDLLAEQYNIMQGMTFMQFIEAVNTKRLIIHNSLKQPREPWCSALSEDPQNLICNN